MYILVRFPLVIVPVINLFPFGSKYILYCLLFEKADGPFKYFSFDSRHDIKLGHPRCLSGKESACQCRRCKKRGFDPLEDPLEEEMATYSSILAWKTPRAEKADRLQSMAGGRKEKQLSMCA